MIIIGVVFKIIMWFWLLWKVWFTCWLVAALSSAAASWDPEWEGFPVSSILTISFHANAFLHHNEKVQRWKTSEHPWSLGSTCRTWRIHPCLWLPRLQWRISGLSLQFNFASQPFPSQARISKEGDGGTIALAIVNTILGGSTGGISVLLLTKFKWIVKNFVRKSSCLHDF